MDVVLQLQQPETSPIYFCLSFKIRNTCFHYPPIKTKFALELKKKKTSSSCKTLASVPEKRCPEWKAHRFALTDACFVGHIVITFLEIYYVFDLADFFTNVWFS